MLEILKSGSPPFDAFLAKLKARDEGVDSKIADSVKNIIAQVRRIGDNAVISYTKAYDGVSIENLAVSQQEIDEAFSQASPELKAALSLAAENIFDFHILQKREGWQINRPDDVLLGQRVKPLTRVGLYVPGGTAAYPSTVLMNAIPAKVAGVKEIIMATPPGKDGKIVPAILTAARLAGVDKIFKMGGAQAVAALAYGTESVPAVDKIVGPGNIYVATAKQQVFGAVDIDMFAGPSEILIIADAGANPAFVAADLMSQAEHDPIASSVLLTTSAALAQQVCAELGKQLSKLSRRDIIEKSLRNYGAVILCQSLREAVEISNKIAPEHLELLVEEPLKLMDLVENAGSIFLGSWSPEPLGDYLAGPNHVLPTSSTSRFFSPLSVDSFIKKSSYIQYSQTALSKVRHHILTLAKTEGLTAHANAIETRFQQ